MRKTRSQTQAENAPAAKAVEPMLSYSRAELNEVRNMVMCFRVFELQRILTYLNAYNQGRKSELQMRVLELLELNFRDVAPKVRDIYKSCSAEDRNSPSDFGAPEPKRMYQPQMQLPVQPTAALVTNQMVLPFSGSMTTNFPINPDVRLKKLAFYDILATLIQPKSLVPTNTQRLQEAIHHFTLTPQQATDIASNRDIRNGSKIEHTIQVQLRFCLLETSCEQEDCFPPNVIVKVNNKLCPLPNPIPTNRPNAEPKRPPRPVNVTTNVKLSPTVTNSISVQWVPDFTRGYAIAAYLVRKLTSSELLRRMKTKGIKPADYTRALIKEKLNEDADCEIATTMLKVSLMCPLGKMRMSIPCRASTCSHLQCFDASLYLQMNERKPTWNCPVCDKPGVYENLVIDGYFQEVLASSLLSEDDNEIQLHKDGSWSTHVMRNEAQVLDTPNKKVQKVEVISDDLELITTEPEEKVIPKAQSPKPLQAAAAAPSNNEPTSTTSNDTVDLTLSDSDDDLPLKRKTVPPKSATVGNGQQKSNVAVVKPKQNEKINLSSEIVFRQEDVESLLRVLESPVEENDLEYETSSTTVADGEIDVEKLVEAIRPREPLWNASRVDSKNRTLRSSLWKEVAREIGQNELDTMPVRKKWDSLRTSYIRNKAGWPKCLAASKKQYKYGHIMSFLDGKYDPQRFLISNTATKNSRRFDEVTIPSAKKTKL